MTIDLEGMPADFDTMADYSSEDFATGMEQYAGSNDFAPIDAGAMAAFAGVGIVFFVVIFAIIALLIASWWKIFTKAGQPGWAAIIPVYNIYIMLKMVNMSPFLLLIIISLFIPILNFIGMIAWFVVIVMMYHKISLAFGKNVGYTLGLVFLSIIFLPILAFGSSVYTKPVDDANAPVPPQDPQPTPQA